MNLCFHLKKFHQKKLAAFALCAALLLQPFTASAAVPDSCAACSSISQARMADSDDSSTSTGVLSVYLSKTTYAYTGRTIRPKVTVKEGGKDVSTKKYTVTYGQTTGNAFKAKTPKAMGYYNIRITFKGTYKKHGTRMLSFCITPKAPVLTSAKTTKNETLKVSWKKVPKASGYTIFLVPEDYHAVYNTEISKNAASGTFSLKDVPAGTYYVHVIAYAKLNGNSRVAGASSNSLTVLVKK